MHFPLNGFFLKRFALIVEFFPFGQGNLDLGLAALEIYLGRDEGIALLPCFADEFFYFPLVEKEFSRSFRIVLGRGVGLGVGAYVGVYEKYLVSP